MSGDILIGLVGRTVAVVEWGAGTLAIGFRGGPTLRVAASDFAVEGGWGRSTTTGFPAPTACPSRACRC